MIYLGWQIQHTPNSVNETETAPVDTSTDISIVPTTIPMMVGPTQNRVARLSHYRPELGGVNCGNFVNGYCVSRMASGERWEDWYGRAAACPREIPFWTTIILPGGEQFFCLDRGGKILTNSDQSIWIDLLVREAPVPFGTRVNVQLVYPN